MPLALDWSATTPPPSNGLRGSSGRRGPGEELAGPRGLVLWGVRGVDARRAAHLAPCPVVVLLVALEVAVLAAARVGAVPGLGAGAGRRLRHHRARCRGVRARERLPTEHRAREGARGRELALVPAAEAAGARLQRRTGFPLVADGPVGVRDVVAAQELQPSLRLLEVQEAVAGGVAGAPLGREDRGAVGHGLGHLLPQGLAVRLGVEMDCVRQVLAGHRVAGGLVDVLGPRARAENDEIVRVLADLVDERLMVRLDHAAPRLPHRLVEDLEEHVWVAAILRRRPPEEGSGLLEVLLGIVVVPIDYHVDARGDGSVHHGLHASPLSRGVRQVAAMLDGHGSPHKRGVPVVFEPLHRLLGPELRLPV
mmetsp:Transcript_58471/g.176713  ORF Transcript_58471/g.176713 Transcript_58471/m.176713 type:complete len:366 (-) Transcript_58471:434-1531(-)